MLITVNISQALSAVRALIDGAEGSGFKHSLCVRMFLCVLPMYQSYYSYMPHYRYPLITEYGGYLARLNGWSWEVGNQSAY